MAIRFEQVLNWHRLSYPGMAIDDWYKLLHQGVYGVGHLLSYQDGSELVEALRRESAGLERVRFHENLIDPLDEDWRLVRLNLRLYARVAQDVSDLVPAMVETARTTFGEPKLMAERVKLAANWLKGGIPPLSDALVKLGTRMSMLDYPPRRHTERYRRRYHPAYRVVQKALIPATLPDDEARQALETRVALDQRLFAFRELGYDADDYRRRVISAARPLPGRMLEVGTGNGGLTLLLAEQPVRLVSIDTDAAAQARVRLGLRFQAQKGQVEFLAADAQHLPFRDREFALVVSFNTFHHLRQADAVLAEMARVCRNRMVIADFNERGLELIRKLHRGEGREHEEVGGDFGCVPRLLAGLGFRVEQREHGFETACVARRRSGSAA
jgi:SAM-dependent methyltransferase